VLQGPHGFTPQALHGPSFRLGNLPNGHYTLIAGSSPYYPGGRVSKTTAIATWGSDRFEFDIDADHQHITHDFLYTNLVGGLSGQVFVDTNKNGIRDAGEVGGHDHVKNIYIDANNNGKRDANEPVAFRGNSNNPQPNGDFWFSRVAPAGNYIMRIELESGWKLQAPQGGSYNRTLNGGQTRDDHYFAIVPA
jgi:hypothetical protein